MWRSTVLSRPFQVVFAAFSTKSLTRELSLTFILSFFSTLLLFFLPDDRTVSFANVNRPLVWVWKYAGVFTKPLKFLVSFLTGGVNYKENDHLPAAFLLSDDTDLLVNAHCYHIPFSGVVYGLYFLPGYYWQLTQSPWCQFHQYFMSSFFIRKFFAQLLCAFNLGL